MKFDFSKENIDSAISMFKNKGKEYLSKEKTPPWLKLFGTSIGLTETETNYYFLNSKQLQRNEQFHLFYKFCTEDQRKDIKKILTEIKICKNHWSIYKEDLIDLVQIFEE